MKVLVLNGSPKGEISVTMQYVQYISNMFSQHKLQIVHIAQRIKKIERNEQAFQEIIDQVRSADGVLWAFPLYYCLVHAHYKRFIELIWERNVDDAFKGKYTAALSTSIHFFDHTAHNYIQAICDDLDMNYTGAFSAAMQDLLEENKRKQLIQFAQEFFNAIENQMPTPKSYMPLVHRKFEYIPNQGKNKIDPSGKKIVVLSDATPDQVNLVQMIDRFTSSFAQKVETINLNELDIKASCMGCLRCGYDNRCAYLGKDEYIDFYNATLKSADILVFAGSLKDRYLSSRWKMFFDRSFFNTHTPSLIGKQFGFIISGPFSQNPNLRQILETYVEFQQSNLAGFVTDEYGEPAEIDNLLQSLAERLVRFEHSGYKAPPTFLSVGGLKLFRDDVWGRLRIAFWADHRAYQRLGLYNFPQKDFKVRVLNALVPSLLKIPRIRKQFTARIKEGMIQPYQKVLQAAQPQQ